MSKRIALAMNVLALTAIAGVATLPHVATAQTQDDATETEDIIYLNDGRILAGKVLSETQTEVEFEIINREFNIRSKMTFAKSEVTRIARDRPVENPSGAANTAAMTTEADTSGTVEDPWAGTFGTRQGESTDESLPSFYFVPLKGQMGTDISAGVYREMIEDIRSHDPDYLVLVMDTKPKAQEDFVIPDFKYDGAGNEDNIFDFDIYRDVLNLFKDELSDIKQVMWIEDSDGLGSIMSLGWRDLYMKPGSSLGGAGQLQRMWAGLETNVDGKYREAVIAFLRGFALYGGYSTDLVDAMVRSEKTLSASWKGRDVLWSLDGSGDYVVDDSQRATANFTAKTAEDFLISKGTAETLDDLALLLGEREYRIAGGRSVEIFEKYVTDWRRMYTNCLRMIEELEQLPRLRLEPLQQLTRTKTIFEQLLKAHDRYEAIQTRMAMDLGLNRLALITQIEILKEQIRALRNQQRGAGGGGGGGSGPSGIGGG